MTREFWCSSNVLHSATHSFIYSSTHSFIHVATVHSFSFLCFHSFSFYASTYSLIYSGTHALIHSTTHPLIYSTTHSLIYSATFSLILSGTYYFIHSLVHAQITSFFIISSLILHCSEKYPIIKLLKVADLSFCKIYTPANQCNNNSFHLVLLVAVTGECCSSGTELHRVDRYVHYQIPMNNIRW